MLLLQGNNLMSQPIDVIMGYGQHLLQGDLGELINRYSLPCAISMHSTQHIVDNVAALQSALEILRQRMLDQGITHIESQIQSQAQVMEDMTVASVETQYFNSANNMVDHMRISYLMREIDDCWKIVMLTVDEPISGVDRLCLPEEIAA